MHRTQRWSCQHQEDGQLEGCWDIEYCIEGWQLGEQEQQWEEQEWQLAGDKADMVVQQLHLDCHKEGR